MLVRNENKIFKVYCQGCDHNLGNVQQFVERQTNNAVKYHAKRWHLKTTNVGFRRCAADDASVVRALKDPMTFTKFVQQVGDENAIRELPIRLPAEHCAHYKPDGAFALERVGDPRRNARSTRCSKHKRIDRGKPRPGSLKRR